MALPTNIRDKRTRAYNKLIDKLWETEIIKYKQNPILKNIDLSTIDTTNFNYNNNRFNYANQIHELYYFHKINGFILSNDDDDNEIIDHIELFRVLKTIKTKKETFYLNHLRRYMAIYKIQQWWKPIFYNPKSGLINNMIDNHYNEFIEFNNFKKRKVK